jgi:TolB-like protein/DNA-binding winged helix-turn-helix (wHTH) protein
MSDESKTVAARTSPPLYEFGPFWLDSVKRLLVRDGATVHLTPKAVEVLVVLVENRGRALEKDELMRAVWPDIVVEENNLARSISSLRKALGEKASEHRYVITIPGRGYRFVAPVREVPRASAEAAPGTIVQLPASEQVAAAEMSSPPEVPAVAPRSLPRRSLAIMATVGALATLLVALGVSSGWRPRGPPVQDLTSLAVLPFNDLSADPEQEYLADGITDALITELTSIRSLRVISSHSAMRYKRSKQPLPAIARELRVGAVVAGTVTRSGSRVRVSAQLLSATSDQHLWAASYEREIGDVLALQTEIARAVAHEVRAVVTASEQARLARRAKVDPEAYELYLRGRYFFNRRRAAVDAETELRKSVKYLEEAIEKDPMLAEAHATLAFTYRVIAYRGILPPWEAARRGEMHARRALELDPLLADAQVGVAAHLGWDQWDWAAAERGFRRAIELSPSDAHARLWYSFLLLHQGRYEDSAAQSAHGLRNDPFHPLLWDNQVAALVALGRHDEAIERARESIELEPSRVDFLGWVYLG